MVGITTESEIPVASLRVSAIQQAPSPPTLTFPRRGGRDLFRASLGGIARETGQPQGLLLQCPQAELPNLQRYSVRVEENPSLADFVGAEALTVGPFP